MKLQWELWVRAAKWIGIGLTAMAASWIACAQAVDTTSVNGTVYLANGAPGSGSLQLSWPAFTTADNHAITAGHTSVTIGQNGSVSVNLAPNLGSTPAGLYYTAVYHMSDGTTSTEYWVVPPGEQASIAQVRAQVMPAVQAVQAVSKAYVDQAVQSINQGTLMSTGGTMTGPLGFSGLQTVTSTRENLHIKEVNPLDYGAVSDAQSTVDGAMTSGSKTLTSVAGLFAAGDVGKTISVQAAGGTGGSQQPLVTTIASYLSSTQVTLAAAATQTVTGMGVIWGTDNYPAFNAWITALPGKKGVIPTGKYLIDMRQSTRTLKLGSNESIVMDRSGTLFYVGNKVGNLGGSLFTYGSSVNNIQLDGLHIVGEWLNTASITGVRPGYDDGGAIKNDFAGTSHDIQFTNSIVEHIFGMVFGDWDNTDYNISATNNTSMWIADCTYTINTPDSVISHNYIADSVSAMEVGGGAHSSYSFNTIVRTGGQYVIALGGQTSGSPSYGGKAIGNIIIDPGSTATGCISIGDGFQYGEIADNVCKNMTNGANGIVHVFGGYVRSDYNYIHDNIIQGDGTTAHLCVYLAGVSGDKLHNNWCTGFYGGASFDASSNIESTNNTWDAYGPTDFALANGATARMRDTVPHGTYNLDDHGPTGTLTTDSQLFTPSGTVVLGALNLKGTAAPVLLNGSAGTPGQLLQSNGPGATNSWTTVNLSNLGSLSGSNFWTGNQTYDTTGSSTFNQNVTFNWGFGANGMAILNGTPSIRISNGRQFNISGDGGKLWFNDGSSGNNPLTMKIDGSGLDFVGINNTAPTHLLSVDVNFSVDQDGTTTFKTAAAGTNSTQGATTAFVANAIAAANPVLTGTSASIGGSALAAGQCSSGTAGIMGATTSMAVVATPNTYPGDGMAWRSYVSSANTVTVKVCAEVAGTPAASTYNVRVIQ